MESSREENVSSIQCYIYDTSNIEEAKCCRVQKHARRMVKLNVNYSL